MGSVQQKTLANELFTKKHSDCTEHVGICLQYGVCPYERNAYANNNISINGLVLQHQNNDF